LERRGTTDSIGTRRAEAEDIRQFSKAQLSAYKVTKSVHIVLELPLTQYGKIDKRRIRAQLIEEARSLRG